MPDSQPPLDDVIAANAFRMSFRRLVADSEKKIRRRGLTPQQYQLLVAIKGAPDRGEALRVADVAVALHVAQSSATELIDRAEARGLVRREASPTDARSSLIRLTEEGERLFADCFRAVGQERAGLFQALAEMEAALQHAHARSHA